MSAVRIGSHFKTVVGAGVTQIIAPASNINGAVLKTGLVSPANGTVNLVAGSTAPSGTSDLSQPIILSGNGNAATGSGSEVVMPYPLEIPAGMGVWVAISMAGGAVALTWDIIS